jgi:hypothetical protein
MTKPTKIEIYQVGLLYLSVCAPEGMKRDEVEKQTNKSHPFGTVQGWKIDEDNFVDGTKNGAKISCCRGNTRHWLLSC